MSGHVAAGLATAVGAAVLYGSAPVAQSVAAGRAAPATGLGLALTWRLARQPIWLLGLGCDIAAFVLEARAFSAAPATLVAPVMACDMLVFVLLGHLVAGRRLTPPGVRGAVAMAGGLGLLAVAFGGEPRLGRPASSAQLLAFLGACLVVAGCAAAFGTRVLVAGRRAVAATAFSVTAGGCYGLATMATRQVGRTFSTRHPWHLLATPTPYVLAACSILGIAMVQRGLQANAALTFPLTSAVSAFVPVVLGAALLGDEVPTGLGRAAFVGALVLLAGGVALGGRDQARAHDVAADASARRSAT